MIKKLLFVWMLCCCGTAFAETKVPVKAPFFRGEALPTPPQQDVPWPHGDDALSQAAAALFEQGLADPRGLEYREIEIAVGDPSDGGGFPLKTRGWVFPDDGQGQRFAVAWNGLVYPVVSVGKTADPHVGWASDVKAELAFVSNFKRNSEAEAVNFAYPGPLKVVMLARLGEVELANRIFERAKAEQESDPYLSLANDWAWSAFERAVCAHERGDDRLALADARLLTRIRPLIDAEVRRRGFNPDEFEANSRYYTAKFPFTPFLVQLPALLADCERRVAKLGANQVNPPAAATDRFGGDLLPAGSLPTGQSIAELIDDLENVKARQWGQPGGVSLASDLRVRALVRRGDEVVEPLLKVMETDDRLTRSVSFGRDFHRSRNLITVSQAAYAGLADLLRMRFKTYGADGTPRSGKELAAEIRAYWARMGSLPPNERFYATLKNDKVDQSQWLQAAANIVQPGDVEIHGSWTTVPNRKPGQKIGLRGEKLRDGRTPSVAQLLAQRSDEIAAGLDSPGRAQFDYGDAGQMALYLAAWDKAAAVPTLKKRLARAWGIGARPTDVLASNGNPIANFGTIIAQMTSARARGGDVAAYDEYAAWIQKMDLKEVHHSYDELLKPLVEGMARPTVAGAIEFIFNDATSPWINILSLYNGFWVDGFWQTPLPSSAGFRRQAARALANKNAVGFIVFHPPTGEKSYLASVQVKINNTGFGFNVAKDDPDAPPIDRKVEFRVCDAFAYFYSRHQKGPKFQLFWPEQKRDAGVLACRKWLAAKK